MNQQTLSIKHKKSRMVFGNERDEAIKSTGIKAIKLTTYRWIDMGSIW